MGFAERACDYCDRWFVSSLNEKNGIMVELHVIELYVVGWGIATVSAFQAVGGG